jgi:hypothetical protein
MRTTRFAPGVIFIQRETDKRNISRADCSTISFKIDYLRQDSSDSIFRKTRSKTGNVYYCLESLRTHRNTE